MSRGSLSIQGTIQDLNVILDQINGTGGVEASILSIPIKVDFHPVTRGSIKQFEMISVKAELRLSQNNLRISDVVQLASFKVLDKVSNVLVFQFPISREVLAKIERIRNQNLQISLSLQAQVAFFETLSLNLESRQVKRDFVTGFETSRCDIHFNIEQSLWVNKILPGLGYDLYKIIELPATNYIIPEEYKGSLKEFDEARKYFNNGDYDKAVGHCRAALEPFGSRQNLQKLKEFVKSKSEFEWATKVLDSTDEWLEKIIKATSAFTSKTHHYPSIGHFSRVDAEIVLMITTAIVAYIGKIEYKPE